jgi:hypothetical protein
MNNTQTQPTCAELVKDQFNQVEQEYKEAEQYFNDYDNATEGD